MDATYLSVNSFKVSGDRTAEFISGRRIKANCVSDGIKYATVISGSYSSPDTTVYIDESTLTSNLLAVLYGVISPGEFGSLPDHSHDGSEGSGGELTVSGSGASTLLELTDTPSTYDTGKYLKSTGAGTEWATVSGGVGDHSALNELDYASAGHTGFTSTVALTTTSGDLQTQIDGKSDTDHIHTTFSGTAIHVDGDATVTGTMYAHVYDSYSPIHIKDDGVTAISGDGSGTIDFPVGLTVSGSPIGASDVQTFLDLTDTPATYSGVGFTLSYEEKIVEFDSTGAQQWTAPPIEGFVEVLLVAGGGGGGGKNVAGGGGAGGVVHSTSISTVNGVDYDIFVGDGGDGHASYGVGQNGEDTTVFNLTASGGGGGGGGGWTSPLPGNPGGSGGGGAGGNTGQNAAGGLGTVGQGNDGGAGYGNASTTQRAGGGGGGADSSGQNAAASNGGDGGDGISNSITGSPVYYGGGGGGATNNGSGKGLGGIGGGGDGTDGGGTPGDGTSNTGGGGGGTDDNVAVPAGSGGSGLVVLKYTEIISTYIGGSCYVAVNETLDGVIFETIPTHTFVGLDDTPTTYSGVVGQYLRTAASGIEFTNTFSGTSMFIDGDATVTGTMYAHVYDSYSPIHIKDDGTTAMLGDGTGVIDFPIGITVSGVSVITDTDLATTSGTLQTQIDAKPDTEVFLTDGTPLQSLGKEGDIAIDENTGTVYERLSDCVITATTWNPADKTANITLSNGNLTATNATVWDSVRSIVSQSSGKWYWEIHINDNTYVTTGLGTSDAVLTNYPGADIYGCGWDRGSLQWQSGGPFLGKVGGSAPTPANSDVLSIALDADNGEIYMARNGSWILSGNPVTRANPTFWFTPGTILYAMMGLQTSNITANFGATSFSYSVPSGYNSVMGEVPADCEWVEKLVPDLLKLSDTPATYAGADGKYLRVTITPTASGIEFATIPDSGETTLSGLTDTPDAYDDGKYLRSTASGTEWAAAESGGGVTTFSGLTDTPGTYDDGKYLVSTASGIEFSAGPSTVTSDFSAYELVQEWNLDGTTFSGTLDWDGDVDDWVRVEAINLSGGLIKLIFNHDEGVNYTYGHIYQDDTVVTAGTGDAAYMNITGGAMDSITSMVDINLKNTGNYRHGLRKTSRYQAVNDIVWQNMNYIWKNDTDNVTSISIFTDTTLSGIVRVYRFGRVELPSNYPYAGAGIQSIKVEHDTVASGIYIGKGVVHIDDGSDGLYSVDSQFTVQPTMASGNAWYYVYVKPPSTGNVITSSEIEYNLSEPTRDLNKVGYYHTTNINWRCIGSIYSNSSNKVEPFMIGGMQWLLTETAIYDRNNDIDGSLTTTWTVIPMTVPSYCDLASITFRAHYLATNTNILWRRNSSSGVIFITRVGSTYLYTNVDIFVPIENQQAEIRSETADSTVFVYTRGHIVPDEIYTGPVYTTISGSAGISDVQTFLDLDDTPTTYSGAEGKYLRATASGTEWAAAASGGGVTTFSGLTDTPGTYDDGKYLVSTASGIEFSAIGPSTVASDFSAYEIIGEFTATSGTISGTITDINGDTDDTIYVVFDFLGHYDVSHVRLVLNGDTNTANYSYYRDLVRDTGSPANEASLIVSQQGIELGYLDDTSRTSGYATVHLQSGMQRAFEGWENRHKPTTNTIHNVKRSGWWTNTADEVTSIDVKVVAGGAGQALVPATGHVRVYKFKQVALPSYSTVPSDFHAYELVQEYNLNNETLSGTLAWDGEVDDRMRVEVVHSYETSADCSIVVRPNNDSTPDNYRYGYFLQDGSSTLQGAGDTSNGIAVGIVLDSGFSFSEISLKNTGKYRHGITHFARYDVENDDLHAQIATYYWKNTADDVTSVTIFSENKPITGIIRVYRFGQVNLPWSGGATTLSGLTDTPDTYGTTSSGSAGNYLMATSSGIEYREFYYYGTGDPPTASGLADGVLYFKYTV